jgi:hypothetical protein
VDRYLVVSEVGIHDDVILPKLDDSTADVFAQIEAERQADFRDGIDLEASK